MQLYYLGTQALVEGSEELTGCSSESSSVADSLSVKIEQALSSEGLDREELIGAVKRILAESMAAITVSNVIQLCQVLVECTASNRLSHMVHPLIYYVCGTSYHVHISMQHMPGV